MQNALEMLKKYFGYSEFNPMQEDIVSDILSGRDVFVLMPTGSGKSLCYQLPAAMKDGITVVVSPLIALMKDQVDSLNANGIGACLINSSLNAAEIKQAKLNLAEGKYKLLYIAPERLSSQDFIPFLKTLPVGLFAIDEAHCISEWGHDFRPEYRRLGAVRANFPDIPIVALTATAIPDVQKDIVEHLSMRAPKIYKSSFNRSNLFYRVMPKDDAYAQLTDYLKTRPNDSGIIYCQSRKTAESLARKLCKDGFSALPYHAGLSADERSDNQELFINDDANMIVATVAFGMGINKTNVRYVIHYDLPKNMESYYQETGRAGRDRLESDCILLFSHGDRMKIAALIEKGYNQKKKRVAYEKLDGMISFCESTECRRKALLGYFGEEYAGGCGKCDNCLNPKEKMDGAEIAKKVIRCVLDLNQRFGANYVISILLGKGSKRSKSYNHHLLASYGCGKEYTAKKWQSFIRELAKEGYLIVSGTKYPVLKINSKSLGLLSGRLSVQLTKPPEKNETETKKEAGKESAELFDTLRLLRKAVADAGKVPPYVIFHDSTLKEMAAHQPQTIESLRKIKGVGQIKLEKYGRLFLDKINEYYPKGYEPWTEDDDICLKNDYASGKTINELAVAFQRTKGAIRSRLKKLGVLPQ